MSEIIIVEKEGFPVISEKHEYGIRGNFYNQIYKFFKKYEPGKLYILSSEMLEDGLAKYVDVNMEQYYNMYGIYFRAVSYTHLDVYKRQTKWYGQNLLGKALMQVREQLAGK